jgi:hypothetical protein
MTKLYNRLQAVGLIVILGANLLLAGCSDGSAPLQEFPTQTTHPELRDPGLELPISNRDFLVGTAGIVPPNFPDSSAEDYQAYINEVPFTGELLGVYVDWAAPDVMETIKFADTIAVGVEPLVALGFNFDLVDETYFSRHLPEIRNTIRKVLDTYELDYFAFGVEVNRLIPEANQETFLDFVKAYREIYDLVKFHSPDTKVFTIFQLENLKGAAYLTGLEFESHWEILELFKGKMDLVGLTIYPFLEYTSVDQIPENYYDEIPEYIDLPIAITEMAWISEDVSIVQGGQEDQVAFLLDILEKTRGWDLEIMLYSFLYEPVGADLFESAALKESTGEAKQIYDYWLSLVGLDLK